MRLPHAPFGHRIGSTIPAADNSADHHAHWHVPAPHIDWGHVAAGMAALLLAAVVMWFFYQP
ncbi:hypothetical protein [Croceicoccus marinus]|jgi:hypothetical protein|uniref:Uncharacterized protein n=1 Tax=Croceicoccus marinus TaxID=450378 RepID=A0A7G6VSA3_9SPHN|nr:hypothetical protein [Croceicoccus marinus]QNE04618.1 hypothetical protein H4O24_11700 [Croceicoccus marinus]